MVLAKSQKTNFSPRVTTMYLFIFFITGVVRDTQSIGMKCNDAPDRFHNQINILYTFNF